MQDRYVGDVGDFGKYGLLKAICGYYPVCPHGLWSLGIVWYRTPDGGPVGDGKYTSYLRLPEGQNNTYRNCDPTLYTALKAIVDQGQRHVRAIRTRNILGTDVEFYEEELTFVDMPHIGPVACEQRIARRQRWLEDALQKTASCEVVFLDPDNGISSPTHKKHWTAGPKYVFIDELAQFVNRGQTAVVYHHLNHNDKADSQIDARINQLGYKFNQQTIRAVLFRRYTLRAYFIICDPSHATTIDKRLQGFIEHGWHAHFDLISHHLPMFCVK